MLPVSPVPVSGMRRNREGDSCLPVRLPECGRGGGGGIEGEVEEEGGGGGRGG